MFIFGALSFVAAARADVVWQTVNYPPNVTEGCSSVDFDGDGTPEVSFSIMGIGSEGWISWELTVSSAPDTELLLDSYYALPMQTGDAVTPRPALGQWQATGLQTYVWILNESSWPADLTNIIVVDPEIIVVDPENPTPGDPPAPLVWGQGVGMPGYGDFMGVRFRRGSDWHYAWVRFGSLPDPSGLTSETLWPCVLEYASERRPGVPILAGAKPVVIPMASPDVARPGYLRLKWSAQVGRTYQVQAKDRLDAFAWTNLNFALPASATDMMIDLPMQSAAQFVRIVEAD